MLQSLFCMVEIKIKLWYVLLLYHICSLVLLLDFKLYCLEILLLEPVNNGILIVEVKLKIWYIVLLYHSFILVLLFDFKLYIKFGSFFN
jgi:hypothetical protein